MSFVRAGPAEILRSSQKDDTIIKKLEQILENILLGLKGPRMSIKYKNKLHYLAHLLYFANSTLYGLQTLGEEYTGIVQVDNSLRHMPSFLQRSLMILLDCFGSTLATSLLTMMEHIVLENNDLIPDAKIKLLNVLCIFKKIIPFVSHVHKAYFYCRWNTYHLSKRITGTNYILIRYWLKDRQTLYGFKFLGIITFINLLILAEQSSKEFITSGRNTSAEGHSLLPINSGTKQTPGKICSMCLNNINGPSCTPCGHVFCWTCILEWLNNDNKCPICREKVVASRVVQLMNYC
ncbi:hypothetical protein O3M35_008112 [Rhynocoris fuscipes]|uniref:RING-type E3 ubiquitin transferase n=1 Tax=Rhynocoris fuscipes TaxID=488301 RepID=A0AAW1D7G7_9HEMI